MVRLRAIGDIHGISKWKAALRADDAEKYIFLGDYVDSYTIRNIEMKLNLEEIISMKKLLGERLILLMGNHDIQYLFSPNYRCSGYRPEMQHDFYDLFNSNRELFQVAYQEVINGKPYLFTHAGVSKHWYNKYESVIDDVIKVAGLRAWDLAGAFNYMYQRRELRDMLFEVGYKRGGMRYDHGGIAWADRTETITSLISDYHQVVGHTPIDNITTVEDDKHNASITYCDCLGNTLESTKKFFDITDGKDV